MGNYIDTSPGSYDVRTYFYDPKRRVLIDEDGWIVDNIYEIMPPNMFTLFKYYKEDMYFKKKNVVFEIVYFDVDDCDDYH